MEALNIRFVNCDRSQALETFAESHLQRLIKRLEGRRGGLKAIDLIFREEARTVHGELNQCEVTLAYRYPGLKRPIVVKKKGLDLRSTLMEVIHAAENAIQKATEKSEDGRRLVGRSKTSVRDFRRNEETALNP